MKVRLAYVGACAAFLGFAGAAPALVRWGGAARVPAAARPPVRSSQLGGDSRASSVLELRQVGGEARMQEVAELYAAWASDTSALPARRLALSTLFEQPSLGAKLKGVLDAVAADPTPPANDPLWPQIVEQLADVWTVDTFDRGRDLMLLETRPRAQQALVASFIRMSQNERGASLSEQQRLALASDFVDVYSGADPAQKAELDQALRLLAGDDVVDILHGRSADPDLQLTADMIRDEAIQEVMQAQSAPAGTEGPKDEGVSERL